MNLKITTCNLRKPIYLVTMLCLFALTSFSQTIKTQATAVLKQQILTEAAWAMQQKPVTITAESSPLSSGGRHDFFSQADYFWPNPANPTGPYINKDGETNPNNFVAHRKAMIRFSTIVGALASAYQLTGEEKYVNQALIHINAWFVSPETLMNPNLSFSQAVIGSSSGRSWGIIDTIHLMEVAQGIFVMQNAKAFDKSILATTKKWFADYILWLNTSKNGVAEKLSANNHSACWVMQVASFAKLCDDQAMLDSLRWRYKNVLLPKQMAVDGSFPLELARTKAYGYSIFNLDTFTLICQILSTPTDNLWKFETDDKKSIYKGISYLYPFVANKNNWILKPDIMFWDNWPVAQPFLIFGANNFKNQQWFNTWKKLDQKPTNEEVIRNLPVRHALLWL